MAWTWSWQKAPKRWCFKQQDWFYKQKLKRKTDINRTNADWQISQNHIHVTFHREIKKEKNEFKRKLFLFCIQKINPVFWDQQFCNVKLFPWQLNTHKTWILKHFLIDLYKRFIYVYKTYPISFISAMILYLFICVLKTLPVLFKFIFRFLSFNCGVKKNMTSSLLVLWDPP